MSKKFILILFITLTSSMSLVLTMKGFGSTKKGSTTAATTTVFSRPIVPVTSANSSKKKLLVKEVIKEYCPSLNLDYEGINVLNIDPPVLEIKNFFSPEICEKYREIADIKGLNIGKSQTFAQAGSIRTSTTWYMKYEDVDDLITNANKLTGFDTKTYEEPQIVRYETGQQFSFHYDTIPKTLLDSSGQRLATLLVYLNDVNVGGATSFKDLNLQVKPEIGKALLFFPSYHDGTIDDRTMHCGQVCMDTKFIVQIWIHQYQYNSKIFQ